MAEGGYAADAVVVDHEKVGRGEGTPVLVEKNCLFEESEVSFGRINPDAAATSSPETLLEDVPGVNAVMYGTYNMHSFTKIKLVNKDTRLAPDRTESFYIAVKLQDALSKSDWVGDQNYVGELFLDANEDHEPYIHADRSTMRAHDWVVFTHDSIGLTTVDTVRSAVEAHGATYLAAVGRGGDTENSAVAAVEAYARETGATKVEHDKNTFPLSINYRVAQRHRKRKLNEDEEEAEKAKVDADAPVRKRSRRKGRKRP